MSVIYKGREIKVTFNGLLFTLDLSFRGIEDISEIKGLENLTRLHVLDLSHNDISEIKGLDNLVNLISLNLFSCNISQIESFANKDKLKKLYLGKNPIYKNLKNVIAKKKKLSKMTWGEREQAGVNPKVWEIAANSRFKLLKQPPRKKNKTPMLSIVGVVLLIIGIVIIAIIAFGVIAILSISDIDRDQIWNLISQPYYLILFGIVFGIPVVVCILPGYYLAKSAK